MQLDDKVSLAGRELALNGAGVRTRVVFKVYVASLYLPQKGRDLAAVLAAVPRRVQLNMLRALSADQLEDALNGAGSEQYAGRIVRDTQGNRSALGHHESIQGVKEKDVISLDFIDSGMRINWNGELKGTIPGGAFNEALMRVWLGDKPVQPVLKKALLGG